MPLPRNLQVLRNSSNKLSETPETSHTHKWSAFLLRQTCNGVLCSNIPVRHLHNLITIARRTHIRIRWGG